MLTYSWWRKKRLVRSRKFKRAQRDRHDRPQIVEKLEDRVLLSAVTKATAQIDVSTVDQKEEYDTNGTVVRFMLGVRSVKAVACSE